MSLVVIADGQQKLIVSKTAIYAKKFTLKKNFEVFNTFIVTIESHI